jgi:hypothetical protein
MVVAAAAAAQGPEARPKTPCETESDGSITVHGKVLFTDRHGREHERCEGRAMATLWFPSGDRGMELGAPADLDIVDGEWRVTFVRRQFPVEGKPAHLSLHGCRIDGAGVFVEPDKLPLEGELVFRLRAVAELRLEVLDAETRQPLDGVEVFRDREGHFEHLLHPGSGSSLHCVVPKARSPFVVPAEDDLSVGATVELWVRAPGHAWQMLRYLAKEGGTRTVLLAGAGALQVKVSGLLPTAVEKLAVRLYQGEAPESPSAEFPMRGSYPPAIEDLTPGHYEVRLEFGDWYRNPVRLGRASIDVAAGKTTEVELQVTNSPAQPKRTSLAGIVVIPREWNAAPDAVCLDLRPIQGTERWTERQYLRAGDLRRGEREGEYGFAFGDLPTGRYALRVEPGGHQQVVRLGASGTSDVRIEVPPPVEVTLTIVDGSSRRPRNGVSLLWNPEWPAGVTSGSPESVHAEPDANQIRFVVPAGRIVVMGSGDDYELYDTLRVSGDQREFEVETKPVYGVKVALYEGNARVPTGFSSGWEIQLTAAQKPGTRPRMGYRGDDILIVYEPGTYVLSVKAPSGYRPVADRQVKLTAGAFPTIDIKVARD